MPKESVIQRDVSVTVSFPLCQSPQVGRTCRGRICVTRLGKMELPQVPEVDRQDYKKIDGARYLNKVAVCPPDALFSPPALGANSC